ncbi:MAG: WD40 repeat domain-containing protein, partial [Beijerinckiaceae bacterium]
MRWLALVLALVVSTAMAEMRGHGGPVRAIAISPDGKTVVTGSFDTTVILWDLERETAKQVLRFHEGPVSAVRIMGNDRFVTAGDDGRIVGWRFDFAEPEGVWSHKAAPVVALSLYGAGQHGPMVSAAHADRTLDTSDGTLARFPVRSLALREAPLAIAHVGAGETVVSFGTQQLFFADSGRLVGLPANANALVSTPDGELIAGGADGKLYVLSGEGVVRLAVEVQELPITSLAVSVDGSLIAAAGLRGAVKIIERATGREVSTLVGPGLPVWSLAFHPDGKMLLTGGADRMVRKWNVATGQPLSPANAPRPDFPASVMNERGAQVF